MKFKVYLKDPDGFSNAMGEAVAQQLLSLPLDQIEKEMLIQHRLEDLSNKLSKWVDCDEYITIEFDLDNSTAIVLPR